MEIFFSLPQEKIRIKNKMNTKKQFSKNLLINGLNFLVNLSIGLLMTPFLVSNLGISSFGLVQIAISLAFYGSILSTSLNQANNRFVSLSLAKESNTNTSILLNTILTLYMSSFLIILPFILLIFLFPDMFFDIDKSLLPSASYLFLLVGVSQLFIMQTTAFLSPAYANNRLDIIQSINILRNGLKLVFIFIFILFISNSLVSVGAAFTIASMVSVIVAYVNFKKFVPFFKYNIKEFDWTNAKNIFHISGWTVVAVLGSLIFLQTDIILINFFLGSVKSGEFAILIQWSMLLTSISTVLSVVISPMILNKYAYNKIEELKRLFYRSIKYQGIFTAIPTALVCVYSDTILSLWVGDKFASLSMYLSIMIVHFGVLFATRQILTVNTAYNKMKLHGLLTLIFGFLHITVSILLLKYTSYGIWSVIVSNLFFVLLLNSIVLPWYISTYLNESVTKIYVKLFHVIMAQLIVSLSAYTVKYLLAPDGWFVLLLSLLFSFLLATPLIYTTVLNKKEKLYIVSVIKERIN